MQFGRVVETADSQTGELCQALPGNHIMSQPYPQPPRRPVPPGGGGFNRPPNPGRGPPPGPPGPPGSSSGRGHQPPRPVPPPDLKIKPPASIFDENQ